MGSNPAPVTKKFCMEGKEIKWTKDGKKVLVHEKINQKQYVVQEIYVNAQGDEFADGERFVTEDLVGDRVITWKQRGLEALEALYATQKNKLELQIKTMQDKLTQQRSLLQNHLSFVGGALQKISPETFDLLVAFMTGQVEWVIYKERLIPYSEFTQTYKGELRIISLFGKTNGDLNYYAGQYSDYSGVKDIVYPFTEYDRAVEKLSELINKCTWINIDTIKHGLQHGINIDRALLDEFFRREEGRLERVMTDGNRHVQDAMTQKEELIKLKRDVERVN